MQEKKFNSVCALYKNITVMIDSLKDLKLRQENINSAMYKLRRQTGRNNKAENDLYIYQYNRQLDAIEAEIKNLNLEIRDKKEMCRSAIISLIDATVIDENDAFNKNIPTLLKMLSSFLHVPEVGLIRPKTGDKYSDERINSIISTEDRKLDNKIAKVIRCGYDDGNGKVLVEPIVCVYQYDKDTVGERQKEVDGNALNRIKDKAKARPVRDFFVKMNDLPSIFLSVFITAFLAVLLCIFEQVGILNFISKHSSFTVGQVIAFFYACGGGILLLLWYNTFNHELPTALDYLYFIVIALCVTLLVLGIVNFSVRQIVFASVLFVVTLVLLVMRIKLNPYSFEEIFDRGGKVLSYICDTSKKYPFYLSCAILAVSEIVGYTVLKTGFLNLGKNNVLFIVELVLVGLVFVTAFVSSLGKISSHEICARDYVFNILAVNSLLLLMTCRFVNASIAVIAVCVGVLILSTVYIVLRITYREK